MVVESQESVIYTLFHQLVNHLVLQVHMLNNSPYKVQEEQ